MDSLGSLFTLEICMNKITICYSDTWEHTASHPTKIGKKCICIYESRISVEVFYNQKVGSQASTQKTKYKQMVPNKNILQVQNNCVKQVAWQKG